MIMLRVLTKFFASSLLLLGFASVGAAPVQHTYNFSATAFTTFGLAVSTAPNDPVVGSFSVTFDPLTGGSGIVDAISLTLGAHTFAATEVGFQTFSPGILIGGFLNGISSMGSFTDDFFLGVSDLTVNNFGNGAFAYGAGGNHVSFDVVITEVVSNPVPEPTSLALFVFGLAALRFGRFSGVA